LPAGAPRLHFAHKLKGCRWSCHAADRPVLSQECALLLVRKVLIIVVVVFLNKEADWAFKIVGGDEFAVLCHHNHCGVRNVAAVCKIDGGDAFGCSFSDKVWK
jgi:hypothetical protein